MNGHGIILYGPPAAGKDTITDELANLDSRYVLFPRLKAGPGRTYGYRISTAESIDKLRDAGVVIWENRRYEATYVIDRPELVDRLTTHVPIVHLGQPEAINAVLGETPGAIWLVAYVWCPRHVAEQRITARRTGDTVDRLRAWDQTPPLYDAKLIVDTSTVTAVDAAQMVHRSIESVMRTGS